MQERDRKANTESQNEADEGRQRHPGPYEDAEEVVEEGGSLEPLPGAQTEPPERALDDTHEG